MKKLILFLVLLVGARAADITVTKVSGTNAITGDLNFPSGRTLSLSSGAHLTLAAGTFSPAANSINWTALTGQPTTLGGYGITDPVVLTSGSYANPAWITSLAAGKITGALNSLNMPAFSGDATSSSATSILTLAASGVTLGTYGSATQVPQITLDAKGRATAASLITITPAFGSLTNTPTSAAGYGIVDGATIDSWGTKAVPSGTVADISSVQAFSNKSISGSANTLTNIPLATAVTGILPSTSHPALTGDVTVPSGSTVTTYAGVLPAAKGGAGSITGLLKANGSGLVSAAISGTDYQPAGNFISALTGDITAAGPGSVAATVIKLNGTSLAGLATGILKNTTATGVPSIAVSGTDYELPLTFSTGLTRSTNTVTVNTSQNIAKLSNLTSNGFVKTSSGDGTLSVDTSTYITGNQTITLSGDASGSGTTSIAVTNTKLNGTSLAGLATGILKNTTATGVPSIAAAGTDYVAPAGAGSVSGLTLNGAVYAASANTLGSTAALTNGQVLIGSTSATPVRNTIAGTANEVTITSGAGTITASLPSALTLTGKTVTGGAFAATTLDGPVGSITPAAGAFTTLTASGATTLSALARVNASGFFTGHTTPGSGAGLEAYYASNTSTLLSYDETGAVYKALVFDATTTTVNSSGSPVAQFTSTGLNSAAIGATTPSTGTFTALSATSLNSTPIGATTPSTGVFVGVSTNSSAAAGVIGEFVSSTVSSGSSVALTSTVTSNVTSVSLTAGDWDVTGQIAYTVGSLTTISVLQTGISSTSGTVSPLNGNSGGEASLSFGFTGAALSLAGNDLAYPTPTCRISLGTTTTIYLVTQAVFGTSTLKAYGTIRARRVR